MPNNDMNKSNTPAEDLDFAEIGRHLASHFASEMARLEDAKNTVDRKVTADGYKSQVIALDPLGNFTLNTKDSTKTVLIQKQSGNLDGLKVTVGEIVFTYPAQSIPFDVLSLPTYSLPIKFVGNAGDSYLIIESTIDNWTLSAALK